MERGSSVDGSLCERLWRKGDVRKGKAGRFVGGRSFMVGSAQGAAGKVKVRDWHFVGTQRNAKVAQNGRY